MEDQKVHVFTPDSCKEQMLHYFKVGKIKGTTTHNKNLDSCWTWRKQEANIITGYSNEGKAEPLDNQILTTKGWKKMLDIVVGDKVFDENGESCKVVAVSEIFKNRSCYKITFSDDASIIVDENHEWLVNDIQSRASKDRQKKRGSILKLRGNDQRDKSLTPFIKETKGLINNLIINHKLNYSVDLARPVEMNEKILELHPYVLGAWLGDGSKNCGQITSENLDIPNFIKFCGYEVKKLSAKYLYSIKKIQPMLKFLNVLNNKHIPDIYLQSSIQDRLGLLQGLMDTDGFVDELGRCEFTTVLPELAKNVNELLCSLGIKVYTTQDSSKLYRVRKKDRYRLRFKTTIPVFRLQRKLQRLKDAKPPKNKCRLIKNIEFAGNFDTKCIEVNSESHMYLTSKFFIPTHNSLFLKQLCMIKALEEDWKFLFCSPEDYPPEEFFDDMIHTIAGRTTDIDYPGCIDGKTYDKAFNLIKDNFVFVYIEPPNNTIKGVLEEFKKVMKDRHIDACIIDPLLKFARPKGFSERDDIYASYIGGLCVDFCRQTNTSFHLVMHQLTPTIDLQGGGKYQEPSMYRVKGGGSWSDGFDNVLSVWRPDYAKDKFSNEVVFSSQKIKKQKLVGIPQRFQMAFDRKSNRYIDFNSDRPIFNFDKFMK